jgi:hypothetical protein
MWSATEPARIAARRGWLDDPPLARRGAGSVVPDAAMNSDSPMWAIRGDQCTLDAGAALDQPVGILVGVNIAAATALAAMRSGPFSTSEPRASSLTRSTCAGSPTTAPGGSPPPAACRATSYARATISRLPTSRAEPITRLAGPTPAAAVTD